VKMLTAESRDFASLLPYQADEALPEDDLFEEYPGRAYRGLAFVMLFNLLLIFLGALLFGTHIL
jgi:hypothetical protein